MNIAEQLKLEGMEAVYANSTEEWKAHVSKVIETIPHGELVTGEDIRLMCKLQAHHPNAWGAMINAHVQRKLLVATGRYKKPLSPKSHARMIQIYKRT